MNHSWGNHRFSRSGTDHRWNNCHQYPQHPGSARNDNRYNNNHYQQHGSSSTQSTAEWDRPGSSSQKWHRSEPEAEEDPDGLPYEPDNEDPELMRKRKELQVIEEQIILKKASIALKTVNVKPSKQRRFTEEPPTPESKKTLKERVKHILLERNHEFRTYSSVAKSRRRSINVQNNHPLKWRVEAALRQRFDTPPVQPQKCKPIPPLSSSALHQTVPSEENEAQKSDQGLMRFLNILNKGVDINELTEKVKNLTDTLPHSSQNSVQTHSLTQYPKTEEQQKRTENILEFLGLNLGIDKINHLGDRTLAQLYGQKLNDQLQTERNKCSPGQHTTYSSDCSSRSSSSSRSPSRTSSPVSRRRSPRPYSPYRKNDSRWRPEVHPDFYPQYPPPIPPYPYPPPLCFNPNIPPPMYPPAYSYSQHITYHNHWAYNQAPAPFNPHQPPPFPSPNIPLGPPPQEFDPLEIPDVNVPPNEWEDGGEDFLPPELEGLLTKNTGPCLIPLTHMTALTAPTAPDAAKPRHLMSRQEKNLMNRSNRLQRKQLYKYIQANNSEKDPEKKMLWREKICFVLNAIKLGSAGISYDPDSLPPKPYCPPRPLLNRKQRRKIIEKEKRKEARRKLYKKEVEPETPPVPPVKEPFDEKESEPEPPPVLTEEEIKANLKKKLEAFNNRMKNNVSQPPKNVEGKDNN